jgi:dynein regulatory complex subunit 2
MLDKNLEEVEDQYNLALRNHLIQIDRLIEIRDGRTSSLRNEFERSSQILYDEFNHEANEIKHTHERQLKELSDMMECVKEEEKNKENIMAEAFQTSVEQAK